MKYMFSFAAICALLCLSTVTRAQDDTDKSKRPSPPASATKTIGDLTIKIDYSQPSLKGRVIGKDVEPMPGEVWRTGANEATTFEVSRDVKINGKDLPKGKYALFSILNGKEWTIIFNKTWNQWGAYKYKESDDALRVKVYNAQLNTPAEKLAFDIDDKGTVSLMWGDKRFILDVK
ncbi:MAG: DUF2911 domain-containing protein [Bacteroidetes bacterium]|nr:DUF2911 domain-containing protein [Bacteroidota bacterium]